jgi:hypothetical protein
MRKIKAQAGEFQGGPHRSHHGSRVDYFTYPSSKCLLAIPLLSRDHEGRAGVKQRWPEMPLTSRFDLSRTLTLALLKRLGGVPLNRIAQRSPLASLSNKQRDGQAAEVLKSDIQ